MKTKLQERREQIYTQSEFSIKTGIPKQVIHQYETGIMKIDGAKIKTLAKIARALNCKISDIVEDPETVYLLCNLN